jgi:hypothetical protein
MVLYILIKIRQRRKSRKEHVWKGHVYLKWTDRFRALTELLTERQPRKQNTKQHSS